MLNPNLIQNSEIKKKITFLSSVFLSLTLVSCGSQKLNPESLQQSCKTKLQDFGQIKHTKDDKGSPREYVNLSKTMFLAYINDLIQFASKDPSKLPKNPYVRVEGGKPVVAINNIKKVIGEQEDNTCKASNLSPDDLKKEQEIYGFGPQPKTPKPQSVTPKTDKGF